MVYQSNFDYMDLVRSFHSDLVKVADAKASRNTNKYGYFAHRVVQNGVERWNEDTINSLTFCFKGIHNLRNKACLTALEKAVNLVINEKSQEQYILCKIFFSLFCSAAKKGIVRLSADINLFGMMRNPIEFYQGFPFAFCFTSVFIELINVSTPKRSKASAKFQSLDWTESEVYGVDYKSWNKCSIDLAKVVAAYGFNDWQDIDVTKLPFFNIEAQGYGLGNMSFHPILKFLGWKLGKELISLYESEFDKAKYLFKRNDILKTSSTSTTESNSFLPASDNPKLSHYAALSNQKGREATGLPDSERFAAFVPVFNSSSLSIDDYSVNLNVLAEYSPEKLKDDTKWKLSQIDYVKFGQSEKGTQKARKNALRYLNLYLFDYLPFFFSNNSTIFDYPDSPQKFDRHIFIEQSLVIDKAITAPREKRIYPVSLVKFVRMVSEIQSLSPSKKNNLARDMLATIRRFFDYVKDNLSNVDGYKIASNPLDGLAINLGEARARSVKKIMDVIYWVNFRIYMKVISRLVLAHACLRLSERAESISKSYDHESAKTLLTESRKIYRDIFSSLESLGICLDNVKFKTNSIDASKIYIKVIGDDFNTSLISVGIIDLGLIGSRTIELTDKQIQYRLCDYQRLLHVLIGCYAGQRGSNSNWLDVDSFDKYFDIKHKYTENEKVQMFVNTDKTQSQGFDSAIEYGVFELLLFAKRIRGLNTAKNHIEPIPYQGNEDSKFGKIRPLLQLNKTNTGLDYALTNYVELFENYLRINNINLGSYLIYCHERLRLKEFMRYQLIKRTPIINDCFINYFDLEPYVRFSPIVYKSELTIHSLRKQLVSVMDVLISDREAIAISTGQADVVIGFYSDLPPEEIAKAEKLNTLSGLFSIVPVVKNDIEEQKQEVEDSIVRGTFGEDFMPFSGAAPSERTNGLTDLLNGESNSLAYNRTHICPSGNVCPSDVVREIGERKCHICYKAVMTKFHAPAIAATIKSIVDDIFSLKEALNSPKLKVSEKDQIHFEIKTLAQKASAWHVRISHINNHPEMMIGNKTKVVDELNYVHPKYIGNHIIARMIETENAPLLQSNILKSKASKMAKVLLSRLYSDQLIKPVDESEYIDLSDPVSLMVQNLRLLSDLKGLEFDELIKETELGNMQTTSLLENLSNG